MPGACGHRTYRGQWLSSKRIPRWTLLEVIGTSADIKRAQAVSVSRQGTSLPRELAEPNLLRNPPDTAAMVWPPMVNGVARRDQFCGTFGMPDGFNRVR